MNIYVGNLSYKTTEEELRQAFSAFGAVSSVAIIKDRETGLPRGFGFVEMPEQNEGQTAITAMNGKDLMGRTLRVNEARPREEGGGRREGGREGYGNRRQGGNGGGGYRSSY